MKTSLTPILSLMALSVVAGSAAPARLSAPSVGAGGLIHLAASGTAGESQVLELSTDLEHWTRLDVSAMPGGAASWDVPPGSGGFHAFRLRAAEPSEIPASLSMQAGVNTDFVRTTLVSVDGASQSFTDDNGVRYQLEIPTGALLVPEDVTFRVVGSASAWPLSGGFLAGVDILPGGVLLLAPATLTITFPDAPGAVLGLAWEGQGTNLHAHPHHVAGASVTLPVGVFGGYGVAAWTPADISSLRAHPPAGFPAQLAHGLALDFAAPPAASPAPVAPAPQGIPPSTYQRILSTYEQYVRPELENAVRDDSLVDTAINRAYLWEVSVQLYLSVEDTEGLSPIREEILTLADRAIYQGLNRAADRCDRHEIQSLGRLVHFGRLMELPPWNSGFTAQDLDFFRKKVKSCARFELELDTLVTDSDPLGSGESQVHGRWIIEFKDEALTRLTGEGPALNTAKYEVAKAPCRVAGIAPSPGSVRIPDFNLAPNARDFWSMTRRPGASGLSLLINPFLAPPQENITIVCPPAPVAIPLQGFWTVGFGETYKDAIRKVAPGQILKLGGWSEGSDEVLGQKDDTATVIADGKVVLGVHARWTLRDAPAPVQ